ncbi:hypothetical protein [Paludifilum halophilum]|uniref:Copper amine oxidase-like N-terminal domain-containing protein n=1 Tax=Paludifilum halophilum TaxID=1642702 RepID=A0A235BAR3_9BACL|nr:hypothetical protein [Paludifilum halophilum]OYD08967.1 hypothetical protein CHM34_04105 [Paludifilum halophilum]
MKKMLTKTFYRWISNQKTKLLSCFALVFCLINPQAFAIAERSKIKENNHKVSVNVKENFPPISLPVARENNVRLNKGVFAL